jgi:desulfoferrodoxin (superoxide reductase-like protein)
MIISVFFLLFVGSVLAHPPRKIHVSYNPDSKELTVFVNHFTNNILKHYVEYIAVYNRNKILVSRFFTAQSSKEGQTLFVTLEENIPDKNLVVKCRCNKFGKKRKNITLITEAIK